VNQIEKNISVTALIEKLIENENELISLYQQTAGDMGDSVITPLLHRIIHEKAEHRILLENELEELNEQFDLDEAII
jgi:rubrerythrin